MKAGRSYVLHLPNYQITKLPNYQFTPPYKGALDDYFRRRYDLMLRSPNSLASFAPFAGKLG
jgi:hypothetical protein